MRIWRICANGFAEDRFPYFPAGTVLQFWGIPIGKIDRRGDFSPLGKGHAAKYAGKGAAAKRKAGGGIAVCRVEEGDSD